MSALYDIRAVVYLGSYRLRVTFADGLVADLDLESRLAGPVGPMFEPLKDLEFFAQVKVDTELGTVVWPNGADLAPEVLHAQATKVA